MKITCQACQAKYTIADDKVVGKVVKIRCKKCGAPIVVNGNQASPEATQPMPGGALDSGSEGAAAVWTVNVADGDQRTITEGEMVTAYRSGLVTDETFCWKEGMADWLPLHEITPLLAVCKMAASPGSRHDDEDMPTRIHDAAEGPLGGLVATVPAAQAKPLPRKYGNGLPAGGQPDAPVAARRAGGRGGIADLFGGVAQAGGEEEVLTSAPVGIPQVHEPQKVTGARNESSPFGAQEQGNGPSAPSMVATSEASGLIDIRQLSAQMRSSGEDGSKKSRVDDIMNLGGGGAFSPSLAAPILSAPSLEQYSQPPPSTLGAADGMEVAPAKSKALIFLAISAALFFVIAAASIGLLLVRGKAPSATSASDDREGTGASTKEQGPAASAPGATMPSPSGRSSSVAAQGSAAPTGSIGVAPAATPAPKEALAKEAKEPPAAAAPPPKEPKAAVAAPPKEGPPAGAPAAEFNMGEARSRLASIAGGVQSCKRGDATGGGKVEIVFAPSGAVQSASLMPGSPFDGSTTGKCVEARFRGARVPPFGGSPFTVSKSFSIN